MNTEQTSKNIFTYTCHTCNKLVPSQLKELLLLEPSSDWLFQRICADYLIINSPSYLSTVDQFSGWISINHIKPYKPPRLIHLNLFCSLFLVYGAPEELSTDGGSRLTSHTFHSWTSWEIQHHTSFVQRDGLRKMTLRNRRFLKSYESHYHETYCYSKTNMIQTVTLTAHIQKKENLPPQNIKINRESPKDSLLQPNRESTFTPALSKHITLWRTSHVPLILKNLQNLIYQD